MLVGNLMAWIDCLLLIGGYSVIIVFDGGKENGLFQVIIVDRVKQELLRLILIIRPFDNCFIKDIDSYFWFLNTLVLLRTQSRSGLFFGSRVLLVNSLLHVLELVTKQILPTLKFTAILFCRHIEGEFQRLGCW